MQHQAARAYQKTASRTASPRVLEANLLSRAATQLQHVRDAEHVDSTTLRDALHFNRKLWNVFMGSVAAQDNELPVKLRENIANLGIFIMNETVELMRQPDLRKIDTLININRQLAAGLRTAMNE
jgi:flagellar protein FlaF